MPQKFLLNILIKRLEGKTELLISKMQFDFRKDYGPVMWYNGKIMDLLCGTMEEIIILE